MQYEVQRNGATLNPNLQEQINKLRDDRRYLQEVTWSQCSRRIEVQKEMETLKEIINNFQDNV